MNVSVRGNVCLGSASKMWAHSVGMPAQLGIFLSANSPKDGLGKEAVLYRKWLEAAQTDKCEMGLRKEGRHPSWPLRPEGYSQKDESCVQTLKGAGKV